MPPFGGWGRPSIACRDHVNKENLGMDENKKRSNVKGMRKASAVAIPAVVLVAVLAGGAAYGASNGWGSLLIGRQTDSSVLTATGQRVTPAGASVEMSGRPLSCCGQH